MAFLTANETTMSSDMRIIDAAYAEHRQHVDLVKRTCTFGAQLGRVVNSEAVYVMEIRGDGGLYFNDDIAVVTFCPATGDWGCESDESLYSASVYIQAMQERLEANRLARRAMIGVTQ